MTHRPNRPTTSERVLLAPDRGDNSAIHARDVRAADLQEELTKRIENRAASPTQSFRRIRRRRRLYSEHRSERQRAIKHSERSSPTRHTTMER